MRGEAVTLAHDPSLPEWARARGTRKGEPERGWRRPYTSIHSTLHASSATCVVLALPGGMGRRSVSILGRSTVYLDLYMIYRTVYGTCTGTVSDVSPGTYYKIPGTLHDALGRF